MSNLPPANSWQPAPGCQDMSSTSPSIAYGVTITGVPAIITATGAAGYVWSITLNDGNTPANFTIDRYDSTGTLIDHPIEISGADGSVTFADPVYLNRDPLAPLEAATKEYVDANSLTGQDAPASGNYVRTAGAWVNANAPLLDYLPSAGGYLGGGIAFNPANPQQRFIAGMTAASIYRWSLQLGDATAESGLSAGSNFTLTSYADTGGSPVAQLTITRTGTWTIPGTVNFTAASAVNISGSMGVQGAIYMAGPANLSIGGGTSGQVLTTAGSGQLLWSTPSGGGGIADAPIDGNQYGRQNANWTLIPPIPPPVIPTDAPAGGPYGRITGAWQVLGAMATQPDAIASPGVFFVRSNGGWINLNQAGYLPLTGGTLTGLLMLNPASSANRAIAGMTGGSVRWALYPGDTTAESGGNAGSNFSITRYSDAGVTIDTPLTISRASGLVSMPAGATVPTPPPGDNSSLAANTAWVQGALASQPQPMLPIGDNRIINGDMRIDQRNNGASGTASVYTVDRWQYFGSQNTRIAWGRNLNSAVTPGGFPYYLAMQTINVYSSTATDEFVMFQSIEADMISDFAWGTASAQPVTLSFWALSSSLTGAFSGSIKNVAGTRSYPFGFSLPTANAWTKIIVTIPGDTAGAWVMSGNAGSLAVCFDLGSGSNYRTSANAWATGNYDGVTGAVSLVGSSGAAFYFTGVKLEIGSVATPFNRQSLAKSMADCQRYYQTFSAAIIGYQLAGGNFGNTFMIPKMRASPTVAYSDMGNSNASGPTTYTLDPSAFSAYLTATASGSVGSTFSVSLSAEL